MIKKLTLYALLTLLSATSYAQWIGGTLQGIKTGNGQIRGNFGANGFINWYTKGQVDSLKATIVSGVSSVFGRTGAVTAQSGDYSSFYPLLNGTGATGTWGINVTGNSGTVTNGVYTTTFNALGDARYYTKTQSDGRYPISNIVSPTGGDGLRYNGSTWINSPIVATAPLQWNTSTWTMSMPAATGSVDGYLTSANWTTFNNKQNAITTGTTAQYFRGDLSLATFPTSLPTANPITFNNSGSGAASGTTFDGSTAKTISYNTLGALAITNNLSDVASPTTALSNLGGGAIDINSLGYSRTIWCNWKWNN